MPLPSKLFLFLGALNALLAVGLGAFGAHAVRGRIGADLMAVYQTASQYHFYHALGLLVVGMVALQLPGAALVRWSGWLMLTGVLLFSGSLYLLVLTGQRWLGAITPFGGGAFLLAWLLLGIAVLSERA